VAARSEKTGPAADATGEGFELGRFFIGQESREQTPRLSVLREEIACPRGGFASGASLCVAAVGAI